MQTQLTIKESARLIELGVDESLASSKTVIVEKAGLCGRWESEVPIFTLADLLSILPKSYFSEEYCAEMTLCMEVFNGKWFVNYRCYCGGELQAQDVEREAPELIDALNQLLIWAIEQGHYKTEKK